MLFLLTQLCLSEDIKCVADIILPPPIEGKKLQFLQVLVRHGARTPLKALAPLIQRGYWICDSDTAYAPRVHAAPVNHYRRFKQVIDERLVDFLPNCREGDLTLSGMEMHYKLGQGFNKYIFNDTHLFDELPVDPQQIFVRNTNIERTLRSAESFLQGAFPPQSPNEIFDIYTDSSDASILRPDADGCDEIKELYANFTSQESFKQWVLSSYQTLDEAHIPEELGLQTDNPNFSTVDSICDYINTFSCNNKRLPFVVTDDIFKFCMKNQAFSLYSYYNSSRFVAGSYAVREMVRVAKLSISETDPQKKIKFSLLSAHDSTVASVYALLGLPKTEFDYLPPYASYLMMELWGSDPKSIDDYTVRFLFNGQNINLASMDGRNEVSFKEFLESYDEINSHCTNFPIS